ncbi:MAG: glycosyltransferase [Proteobacteria bacterium]|nr:glycosyltransferase [Pseudomonadota bacterium]
MSKKIKKVKAKEKKLGKPLISACMIVKNEEALLPNCLKSIRDVVDEIIVVDTGSSDSTVEIAKSYGAKVYHHLWENDFSKHRNQSISYATGEWILIIDADEELEAKTGHIVRTLVRNAPTGVILFKVRSYLEDGAYYSEGSSPRLFKNGLDIYYRGKVHNQIIFKESLTPSPVVLWHYGYDLTPEKKRTKIERSLALLRQQAAEWPDDIPTHHHLAMTLMAEKDWEGAYREAALTLDMARAKEERSSQLSWTYFVASNSLLQMRRFDEAKTTGLEGLERFVWSIDLHHCLTQIYFSENDYDNTLKHGYTFLDLCEKLTTDISFFPVFQFETVHQDWVVYRSMGYASIYLGKQDQGVVFLKKAVKSVSKNARFQIIEEIGINILKLGLSDTAIEVLEMLPTEQVGFSKGIHALARAYKMSGRKDEAVSIYQKLQDLLPEDTDIPFRMGLLLLELCDYDRASGAFETVVAKAPENSDAFINWGIALEKQRLFEKAEDKYRKVLLIDPESPKAALNLGLLLFQKSCHQEALHFLAIAFAVYPADIHIALTLSIVCLETGNIEGMIGPCESLLRILELPSNSILQSISDLADLYLMIAHSFLAKSCASPFEMAVDIGLRLGPGNTDIIADLTRESIEKGEYGTAVRLLETGLSLNPKDERLTRLALHSQTIC